MTPHEALLSAKAKAEAAAIAQFAREGNTDCGSCGGAMLELDKRSKLLKAAREMKMISHGGFVMLGIPESVQTQSANVYQEQMRAFRLELEALGFGKAIKRYWNYID